MTENVRKIFDIIGVKPNERFKVKCDYETYNDYYYINENLKFQIDKEDYVTSLTTLDVIRGDIEIVKIPKYEFTKEEKIILKGFKQIGYNYIVRDENGRLSLFYDKPHKIITVWNCSDGKYTIIHTENNMFKSIKWEDSEPFEIPNFENKQEYETDKEQIKNKLIEIYKINNSICTSTSCNYCDYQFSDIGCEYKMFIDNLIENNFTFLKSEE